MHQSELNLMSLLEAAATALKNKNCLRQLPAPGVQLTWLASELQHLLPVWVFDVCPLGSSEQSQIMILKEVHIGVGTRVRFTDIESALSGMPTGT